MNAPVAVSGVVRRVLCAVLLNPPLRPAVDTISHRNLLAALPLTGCTELRLTNLIDLPSKDQRQLASFTVTEQDLARSRQQLSAAIHGADEILFAWGTGKIAGAAGSLLKEQAEWVRAHVGSCGVSEVWMVSRHTEASVEMAPVRRPGEETCRGKLIRRAAGQGADQP